MNKKIEQLILNLHGMCIDRMSSNDSLTFENLLSDSFLQTAIPAMYNADLNESLKNTFSFDDLLIELTKLFEKKKPTQSIAQDYLEPWLNSSIRANPEIRFSAYKKLLTKERKGEIIAQMDADTYKILDSCYNPNDILTEWDRRGLVYGHVQSGKTANYIGLINRAFDSGYRIIIVLTGMTEDLRVQTQRRVDEGVVGQRDQEKIGIGNEKKFDKLEDIIPATSILKDLSKNDDLRASVISTRKKSIWVIKKNKAVLENLIFWLDKQRANGDDKIYQVPFLVIDDEADNASIQSMSKKDYDDWGVGQSLAEIDQTELTFSQEEALKNAQEKVLKAINRNIRVALSLMAHKTFVAYTATPYSIINQTEIDLERKAFINGKEFIIDQNSDLFPSHFIIPISAGKKYMGVDRIFTTEKYKKLPVVVNLSRLYPSEDFENSIFPTKRGICYSFNQIPRSLENAIFNFIISIVIRKYRGHEDYNSLLIHTSHLTENVDYLADKVEDYITKMQEGILTGNGGFLERINFEFENVKLNSSSELFKEYFEQVYLFPERIEKEDVLNVLLSKKDGNQNYIYAPFEVVSYHSSIRSELKHKHHTLKFDLKDKTGKKRYKNYIVIGGNRLSRGLTIEGLTTSYFVRNSTRQDSLYQMARWFGYRVGFEDLVRIYMPEDQILWFEGVFKLERDLRKDFEDNNEEDTKMLPRDAIIKIANHTYDDQYISSEIRKKYPSICDPNKLRHTKMRPVSFCGTTKTNRIKIDASAQNRNINALVNLLELIKSNSDIKLFDVTNVDVPDEIKENSNLNFTNVPQELILNLLENYEADDKLKDDLDALIRFIDENKKELKNWSLVIVNRGKEVDGVNLFGDFYHKGILQIKKPLKIVSRDKSSIKESPNTLYFKSILDQQKDNIFDVINKENVLEYRENNKAEISKKYRNKYKKPLLLIYLATSSEAQEIKAFPLLYCFIPEILEAKRVKYIVRNQY